MKIIKVTFAFLVLALAIIGLLTVLEIIPQEEAIDIGGKLSLIAILFGATSFIFSVALTGGSSKSQENDSKKPGPKF